MDQSIDEDQRIEKEIELKVSFLNELYRNGVKRTLDLVLGLILLVLISPILGLAWLAVRLSSRGPVVFSQPRVGLNGEMFVMYKFRSMYVDQARHVDMEEISEKEKQGVLHKLKDDPRVTPVGRLLRKTSVDELLQVWNVVIGDMSLVGPRPLVPHMLAPYPEIRDKRNRVRPGITGLWQIYARSENNSVLGMVEYDMGYIERCSFLTDLLILLKTPLAVISMKGAE